MRNRLMSCGTLAATLLLFAVPAARAQVDWSDLFPGEGKPVVQAPAPAAAKPQPAAESRKVAKPQAAPAKVRHRVVAKARPRALAKHSRSDSEFPEIGDVAAPRFDERRAERSSPPPATLAEQRREEKAEEPVAQPALAKVAPKLATEPVVKANKAEHLIVHENAQTILANEPKPKVVAPVVAVKQAAPVAQAPAADSPKPRVSERAIKVATAPDTIIAAGGTRSTGGERDYWSRLGVHVGDVVTAENVDKYKQVLSPGLEWAISYGLRMRVVAPRPIVLPRAYLEATEKYSGQVALGPDGATVLHYVAGQPFPNIDLNDPQVALKIMWNYSYGGYLTDDLNNENFDADTGSFGKNKGMTVERHYLIDNLRRLVYTGRLYVDPKPNLPNDDDYRYKESIHPLSEPFDLKGVGATFYRYNDVNRQDDSWLYLPQLRRVRRLSSAQRSDALFGQDTDPDSYYGYTGQIGWADWKFLGERTVLAIMHAQHRPVKWQVPEDWAFDDVWEPRQVYVLEGVSKLPQYAYGKRVLFIDKQAWVITHSDIYDHAGQLWKVWINNFSFRHQALPGGKVTHYADEMPFQPGIVMLDTQLVHGTKAALPSTNTPNQECTFFNMGAKSGTTEEFFTVANLIEMGH